MEKRVYPRVPFLPNVKKGGNGMHFFFQEWLRSLKNLFHMHLYSAPMYQTHVSTCLLNISIKY